MPLQKRNSTHKKSDGFTLIELMITIAIAAILASLAIPSMSNTLRKNKIQELSSEFTAAVYLAQSEAIKRGIQVTLRPLTTANGKWEKSWDIFEDINGDGIKDAGETLIQIHQMPSNGTTLLVQGSSFSSWLAFLPSGSTKENGGRSGSFLICQNNEETPISRLIKIQASGNVIIKKGKVACP